MAKPIPIRILLHRLDAPKSSYSTASARYSTKLDPSHGSFRQLSRVLIQVLPRLIGYAKTEQENGNDLL